MGNRNFDFSNPKSIEEYAQKMIGHTFSDIDEWNLFENDDTIDFTKKGNKGGLGNFVEERFFGYKINSDPNADFNEAGVELKVTPYKKNKNGSLSAKERLILTMIDYMSVVNENFENSHLWQKARLILLVYYLYDSELENRFDYTIDYVKLFTPPVEDIKIIKEDFEKIVNKIRDGKAHELSEADTLYLGAAPKASSSKDRRKQPFSDELAKPRAFSFKSKYMTYVLNKYIVPGKETYEPIIKENISDSFEDYVIGKINNYKNKTVKELCSIFNISDTKAKNLLAIIAYRILGIKGNKAEEFVKANIVVKTIRVNEHNTIKENMSFPSFKFKELIKEEWDNCTFGNYLRETKFLFIVYKMNEEQEYVLKGAQFWNIPYKDLEIEVKKVWEETKKVLINGLEIEEVNGKLKNNFPKQSQNPVCHVRPHAKNKEDTYDLPDGRKYPKQCFWLNRKYILSQLNKEFFE